MIDLSDSSFSPPSIYNDRLSRKSVDCVVCGDKVVHKHFSKSVCDSCAAFFRRIVYQSPNLLCRESDSCWIERNRHKKRCSYCRFQKCMEVGLDMNMILRKMPNWPLSGKNDTTLQLLQKAHSSSFINRRRYAQEFFDLNEYISRWEEKRSVCSHYHAAKVESFVLRDFLRKIRLFDSNEIGSEYETYVCSNLWHIWMLIEALFITRAHGGQRTKKLYTIDHSYLELNEDILYDYYKENQWLINPRHIARIAMDVFPKHMKVIEVMQANNVDEVERVVLLFLALQRMANIKLGNQKRMQKISNQLFCELKQHYREQYNDVAIRIGQLILLLQLIEELYEAQQNVITQIRLEYKKIDERGYECYDAKIKDFHNKTTLN